ncbi:Type I restriction-modification system, specificity subunit S [Marinobacterium lacunae]|uniref:Type I restriction-modification system, specificity subunit S n=1 Tax=Marinobacterium lacunae TaxID=1232683 RepID=A0A081FTK1_9GAMM|nr:restriction endonuclease subunit S [Marinobacterium lacunae]KEA61856.1 Type I restriction-modification system, specificity subunit S [Marinobacterium lacunae]
MSAEYNPSEFVTVPNGWDCRRLLDCTTDRNISYGIVQPGQHCDDGIPIIRVNNINNGQVDLREVLRVSPEIEAKYQRTRLKGGEVLLTLVGSTGQSVIARDELVGWNVPRAIAVIRPSDDIGCEWINICLQSSETKHFLDVRANTTVQKTLNLKDVRDIPILLPPTETRKAIASIATNLTNKIQLNHQINQTLEQMAQAIFKSWFVNFEPVNAKIAALDAGGTDDDALLAAMQAISGKDAGQLTQMQAEKPEHYAELRATAELFPSAMQDSELGEIPDGWYPVRIEHYLDLAYGKALKKTERVEGEYPVYGSGGITGSHNKALVSGPGIIVGRKGTVGSIYWENQDFFPIDTTYYVTVKNDCTLLFSYYLLQTLGLENMNTDAAVPGLNRNNVYRLEVPHFPVAIIERFDQLASPLSQEMEARRNETESLTTLRDTLLPKLLSGKLTLPDTEEPRTESQDAAYV